MVSYGRIPWSRLLTLGLYDGCAGRFYNRQFHILQFVYVLLGCSWENYLNQDYFVAVVNIAQLLPLQQLVVYLVGRCCFWFRWGSRFWRGYLLLLFLFLLCVCLVVRDGSNTRSSIDVLVCVRGCTCCRWLNFRIC